MSTVKRKELLVIISTIAFMSVLVNFFNMEISETGFRTIAVNSNADNAATGSIFDGKKIRTFNKHLKCTRKQFEERKTTKAIFPTNKAKSHCSLWAVVTTINAPTESINRVANLTDTRSFPGKEKWCLVIVGDTKTPNHLYKEMTLQNQNVIFLSIKDQQEINHAYVQAIPYKSFARKNVGYLYAIAHGAKAIFDFDDDNVLKPNAVPYSLMQNDTHQLFRYVNFNKNNKTSSAFNPFPLMHPSQSDAMSWPRGFPLELVKDETYAGLASQVQSGSLPRSSVAVIQSVCDGDPDVDAVHRLTRPLPFTFDNTREASKLLVPARSYSPYNAQATVHTHAAFWGLLLPFTVTGRVTDIWRSYFTQRIMQDLQLALVYAPPMVDHTRSSHSYLADMQAEDHLYQRTFALLEFLSQWEAEEEDFLPARIEKLWIALYERDYIGLQDVDAVQNWLMALQDVGYEFPGLPTSPTDAEDKFLKPTEQPELQGQPFLARPYYNAFNALVRRPDHLVVKLVMMTKDEWPLLKHWTLYHGELLGYENIYILDDSTDPRCTAFLRDARDHYGANVIFTPANLNELEGELTWIGKHIKGSSDLSLKMDTDEFFVVNHPVGEQKACTIVDAAVFKNCSLSPYAVDGFLKDMDYWSTVAKGQPLRVEMQSGSSPQFNREICDKENVNIDEVFHHLPLTEPSMTGNFKAVYDSRFFESYNLGGHALTGGDPVRVGIIHFHFRCYHHEVSNSKKAVLSHKYIDPDMTDKEALSSLVNNFIGKGACQTNTVFEMKFGGASTHKILAYAKSLECPEQHKNEFYEGDSNTRANVNTEFKEYMDKVLWKYGFGS